MHIYSVTDPEFKPYGKILEGYDTAELLAAMEAIPLPEEGTAYRPGIESLEACAIFADFRDRAYGGMPIQLGMCWGHNTKLNCLEYHRDSEVNVGTKDFILLLGRQEEITDGVLDTDRVKAFRVPKGLPVEVYATTLHYAPLPHLPALRLPRGRRAAARHQHRQARLRGKMRGGRLDDRPQQVAAGPSRFQGSA